MGIIDDVRQQSAVYWELKGYGDNGEPVFDDPVEITCRWVDENAEFLDAQGRKQITNASVLTDRLCVMGSLLRKGTLEMVDNWSDPKENDGTYEIRKTGEVPDIGAEEFLRYALL